MHVVRQYQCNSLYPILHISLQYEDDKQTEIISINTFRISLYLQNRYLSFQFGF